MERVENEKPTFKPYTRTKYQQKHTENTQKPKTTNNLQKPKTIDNLQTPKTINNTQKPKTNDIQYVSLKQVGNSTINS